jgi:putative acetyltransferase
MTATLSIEPAHPGAARPLIEASHRLMQSLFPAESNHYLSLDALAGPDVRFLIARDGDTVLGCGALKLCDGYGEVKSMFTAPEGRGRGIAAAILTRLEAEARAARLPCLRLETGDLLHEAHRLYARHGFEVCGPFGDYTDDPRSLFMEKRLT